MKIMLEFNLVDYEVVEAVHQALIGEDRILSVEHMKQFLENNKMGIFSNDEVRKKVYSNLAVNFSEIVDSGIINIKYEADLDKLEEIPKILLGLSNEENKIFLDFVEINK
ncbi:hypothetical protein H3N56_12050 [Cetobacterium sp. 2A]|uniref:hypothetical protein n=1 Tax=unclassified Cetobacterium TaxID=2630983 RepID=UPI00163CE338|nr:hypothetical protein [Cetobacterium sp. 2A]MBC2857167.1 hypothetical protein [Cetobacterium sp. 2A]